MRSACRSVCGLNLIESFNVINSTQLMSVINTLNYYSFRTNIPDVQYQSIPVVRRILLCTYLRCQSHDFYCMYFLVIVTAVYRVTSLYCVPSTSHETWVIPLQQLFSLILICSRKPDSFCTCVVTSCTDHCDDSGASQVGHSSVTDMLRDVCM